MGITFYHCWFFKIHFNFVFLFFPYIRSDLTFGVVITPAIDDADLIIDQPIPDEVLVALNNPLPAEELVANVTVVEEPAALVPPPADNGLPSVSNNATWANESGTGEVPHDDIPSFSEWTQKVLAEEEKSGEFNFLFCYIYRSDTEIGGADKNPFTIVQLCCAIKIALAHQLSSFYYLFTLIQGLFVYWIFQRVWPLVHSLFFASML